jgi:hypothetical protein
MWPAFPASEYYGPSATPRQQQRTVRLPEPTGLDGHHRDASHVHHAPVGRVGAQLYPCGIAARHRNTPHSLARANINSTDKTSPITNKGRAPRQPTAASFRAGYGSRGFNHWFGLPTPFCLASPPGPLAATHRYVVGATPARTPHLKSQTAPSFSRPSR